MKTKNVVIGLAAATIMSSASATPLSIEKQSQTQAINKLLEGITVTIVPPECTIKQLLPLPV